MESVLLIGVIQKLLGQEVGCRWSKICHFMSTFRVENVYLDRPVVKNGYDCVQVVSD